MKLIRILIFLIVGYCLLGGPARAEIPDYDPQITMQALNMAIVSLKHIITTGDRVVLDQEYDNVINNLSIGNIESDPEIIDLYGKILEAVKDAKLTEAEKKFNEEKYRTRETNLVITTIAGMWPVRGGDLVSFLGGLGASLVTSFFSYQNSLADIHAEAEEFSWQLDKDRLEKLTALQVSLLNNSWMLMNKYHLPDRLRISQQELDWYEQAMAETTPSTRLFMLGRLSDCLAAYPPYWFSCAQAAEEVGDVKQALDYLAEFDKVNRPVLRRDPYAREAAKKRLSLDTALTAEAKRELLNAIEKSLEPTDWVNNLFCGVMRWSIDDKKRAIINVQSNLSFKSETKLSAVVLKAMKEDGFTSQDFYDGIIQARAEEEAALEPTVMNALKYWFEGDDTSALRMAEEMIAGKVDGVLEKGPIPYLIASEILRCNNRPGTKERRRALRFNLIYLGLVDISPGHSVYVEMPNIAVPYAEMQNFAVPYAERGVVQAQLLLGHCYGLGWGIEKNSVQSAKWYRLAALQENAAAQNWIGLQYFVGDGVPQDHKAAKEWFERSAADDYEWALFYLASFCEKEDGSINKNDALGFMFKAAALGLPMGQSLVGASYWDKYQKNEPRSIGDLIVAINYTQAAAKNGEPDAQKNCDTFRKWIDDHPIDIKSEDYNKHHNDATFTYFLGIDEQNVKKDFKRAFEYFYEAAAGGSSFAQYKLGSYYENGTGVFADYEESYKWYYLAHLNGYEDSDALKRISEGGFFTSAKLDRAGVQRAREAAQKYYDEHFRSDDLVIVKDEFTEGPKPKTSWLGRLRQLF